MKHTPARPPAHGNVTEREAMKITPITLPELRLLAQNAALSSVVLKAEGEKWIVIVNNDLVLHKQRNAVRQFGSAATALDLLHAMGCSEVLVDLKNRSETEGRGQAQKGGK